MRKVKSLYVPGRSDLLLKFKVIFVVVFFCYVFFVLFFCIFIYAGKLNI